MAEYIKIEKTTFPTFYKRNLTDYGKGWNACLKSVLQHKTADVVEVKRGEWIKVRDGYPRYACSRCHHLYNNMEYKYCPNCGAKMEKEKTNE